MSSNFTSHLRESVGVYSLPGRAVLELDGEDVDGWLQGQVTNDVSSVEPGGAVYALVTTAKGKILADAWILRHRASPKYWLTVPHSAQDALLQQFDRQIIMEDVEVALSPYTVITVQGPLADQIPRPPAAPAPASDGDWFPCDRLGYGGWDVVVPQDAAGDAVESLSTAARTLGGGLISDAEWEAARIEAGRPRFGVDFDSGHYPQEAGLGTRAVSFTKGCYVGQEVVCMLESRGQVSRCLVYLRVPAATETGHQLEHEGTLVGQITSVSPHAREGGRSALGMVKRKIAETSPTLDLADGAGEIPVLGTVGTTPSPFNDLT